jgi:hypothetical protein
MDLPGGNGLSTRRGHFGAQVKVFGAGACRGREGRARGQPLIAKNDRKERMSSEDGETEEPDDDSDDDEGWESESDDDS